MAEKSPAAFRTIREVSDALGVPQHVLRFWETRFPELKPLQRSGNRRYYRPADVALAGALKRLLHEQGYTVRGAQQLLAAKGVAAAMAGGGGGDVPAPVGGAGDASPADAPPAAATAALAALRDRLAAALAAS